MTLSNAWKTRRSFLYTLALLLTIAFNRTCVAQENDSMKKSIPVNKNALEDRIENIAGSSDQEIDYSSLLDQFIQYKEHPLNLNAATHDELSLLTILNELQINALTTHIHTHGKLISIYELQGIPGFDLLTIYKILPYVKVDQDINNLSISFKELIKNGKHQILARTQRVNEIAKGYLLPEENTAINNSPLYPGSPYKVYTRYRFNYTNRISWGLTCEKDPGELFFKSNKKSFDFYSAHLFLNNHKGFFKTIALGDYQLQFGQGLAVWSGLAYSKSPDIINIKKYGAGIKSYASADENLFMRGAATTVVLGKFETTLFYSGKKSDANVMAKDTVLNEVLSVSSLQQTGLHRTTAEISDKNSLKERIYGGHLAFKTSQVNIGITGLSNLYSAAFEKSKELYKRFDFSGNVNTNLSFDYSFIYKNYNFFGESGRSSNGGLATINGLLVSLGPTLSMSFAYRNYQRNYQALLAKAFGESYASNNENGTYIGLQYKPVKSWTFSGYYDLFKFPWLNYLVDAPSYGQEYFAQLTYTPSKTIELYGRCKFSEKQKNGSTSQPINFLVNVHQTNYRFNISYKISKAITLQNRLEYIEYQKENNIPEKGFLMYQDINYKSMKSPVSFNLRYTLFDTDSYNSRLYAYQNDIMYVYSIPAHFYRGATVYFNCQYRLLKIMDIWMGYHLTMYDNRNTIGTGLDEIAGSNKSEIKMQVRIEL